VAGSVIVYAGLLLMLAGSVSVIRPLRLLRIPSRPAAAAVLGAGLALALAGAALPAAETRSSGPQTRLDDFVPAYQFGEVHETRIHASPDRVYSALRAVTAEEIRLFRTLTWIRNPGRPWVKRSESILAPPARQPILDVALRSGFLLLADKPGQEIVVGTIVCCGGSGVADPQSFADLSGPGFAKAGMNFVIRDEGGGWSHLRTETRVYATDASARRRFAVYWRVIYPGSALIRRMWLRAVKERAEGTQA